MIAEHKIESNQELKVIVSLVNSFDVCLKYLDSELRKYNSNLIRFRIMSTLYIHGGKMMPTEISKRTFRAKHTITPIIRLLQRDGLINMKRNPKDRRSTIVYITKKGRRACEEMIPIANEFSQIGLSCFDNEGIERLYKSMKQLRRHLEQISVK